MKLTATQAKRDLESIANSQKAKFLARFFRTGKGEYAEGDVFYGITVPQTRTIAKKYGEMELGEIKKLLQSKMHEDRLCALLILSHKFKKADENEKKQIFDFYIANLSRTNNWDLVDLSADKICGEYIATKDRGILYKLAKSENLWERRVSIVSTFALIKRGEHSDTFKIAKILLHDKHDLIHKATGWMLREAGKRGGLEKLEEFLQENASKMPRTMLRYAIEKMGTEKRKYYMEMKNRSLSSI